MLIHSLNIHCTNQIEKEKYRRVNFFSTDSNNKKIEINKQTRRYHFVNVTWLYIIHYIVIANSNEMKKKKKIEILVPEQRRRKLEEDEERRAEKNE